MSRLLCKRLSAYTYEKVKGTSGSHPVFTYNFSSLFIVNRTKLLTDFLLILHQYSLLKSLKIDFFGLTSVFNFYLLYRQFYPHKVWLPETRGLFLENVPYFSRKPLHKFKALLICCLLLREPPPTPTHTPGFGFQRPEQYSCSSST